MYHSTMYYVLCTMYYVPCTVYHSTTLRLTRYLSDLIHRMTGAPAYLDSSDLVDLGKAC